MFQSLTHNKKLGLLFFGTTFFLLLAISLLAGLFFYQRTYADKIYPNVYVENIDLSGLTEKQAAQLIKKFHQQIQSRPVTVKAGDKETTIKLADTGASVDVAKIIEQSYQIGRTGTLPNQYLGTIQTLWKKEIVNIQPVIDQPKYDAFVNLLIPQLTIEAKDASLRIEEGKVIETAETIGQSVNLVDLPVKILALVRDGNASTLELQIQKVQPKVVSTSQTNAKETAESLIAKKITLQYEGQSFSPSQTEIGNWIEFKEENGQLKADVDQNEIRTYLLKIAKNFEIQKINRKVNATDGSVLVEGREGKILDKDSAVNQIMNQIYANSELMVALSVNTVPPAEEKVFPAVGIVPGRFPGKYVDVDLTQQKLCRIEGNNILDCTLISSGKRGFETPEGTYSVQNKSPRQYSYKYSMWLPWWQAFKGDYGLHELPETDSWKETPEHLGKPVSHGCVRLGVGPAESLYNWTEVGTPVYVHK